MKPLEIYDQLRYMHRTLKDIYGDKDYKKNYPPTSEFDRLITNLDDALYAAEQEIVRIDNEE